jgi:secreted trypsin-like serine protease
VGGTETKAGEVPWRAAVFIADLSGRGYQCGGTIINQNWIMTAAHCTDGATPANNRITIWTGAQANPISVGSGTSYKIDRWVQHPQYSSTTMNNDITLLHVERPMTFAPNVSPACLPWNMVATNFSGASVLASGWGTTKPVPINVKNTDPSSTTLLKVTLPLLTTTECQKYMGSKVTDNMICTYKPGYDTCQGDSGGSIDYQSPNNNLYYAVGIVSFGYGCAQENAPGVYAKVTKYLPWIQATAAGETFCNPQ